MGYKNYKFDDKLVVIALTEREAMNTVFALGNSIDDDEDAMSLFDDNKRDINSARNAKKKIKEAIQLY